MSDPKSIEGGIQKAIDDGIIEPAAAEAIYRLIRSLNGKERLSDDELARWVQLGYLQDKGNGKYRFEIEKEPVAWSLMSLVWLGILERRNVKGEWTYKQKRVKD